MIYWACDVLVLFRTYVAEVEEATKNSYQPLKDTHYSLVFTSRLSVRGTLWNVCDLVWSKYHSITLSLRCSQS